MEYNHYNSKYSSANYKTLAHTISSYIPTNSARSNPEKPASKYPNTAAIQAAMRIPDLTNEIIWCNLGLGSFSRSTSFFNLIKT